MNGIDDKYILSIVPIDDKTASLVKIEGVKCNDTIFDHVGLYVGYDNLPTPRTVLIEKGIFNQNLYEIIDIKDTAFSHCRNLETIIIGKSVSRISWNMYQCNSLLNIFVSRENKIFHDIDGVLFLDKELIAFPQGRIGEYVIPMGTKRIGNHSFKSAHINRLIIPEGVEEIGINAFYECKNLKEIILPSSIKQVSPNYDIGYKPISQIFYCKGRNGAFKIDEIIKMFPE